VLRQFSTLLGNRIQFLVTGSAMTSPTVKDFVRRCFGKPLYDGYGTTEAGGIATDDTVSRGVDVRLEDVPDLGYTNSDKPYPRGEICVKTKVMINGYHKNSAATKAAFTERRLLSHRRHWSARAEQRRAHHRSQEECVQARQWRVCGAREARGSVCAERADAQICVVGDTKWDCLLAVVVPNRRVVEQRHIDVERRRGGGARSHRRHATHWQRVRAGVVRGAVARAGRVDRVLGEQRPADVQREAAAPQCRGAVSRAVAHTLRIAVDRETAAVSSAIDAVVAGNDAVDSLSAVRLQSVLRSKFAVDVSVAQLLQADSKEALLRIATTARAGGATDELSNELQSAVARDVELLAGMPMPPTSASRCRQPTRQCW
jgi:hypothetical protein